MDNYDSRQEERKRIFKPINFSNIITQREDYAVMLRKDYKRNILEDKRSRTSHSPMPKLESAALDHFSGITADFFNGNLPLVI